MMLTAKDIMKVILPGMSKSCVYRLRLSKIPEHIHTHTSGLLFTRCSSLVNLNTAHTKNIPSLPLSPPLPPPVLVSLDKNRVRSSLSISTIGVTSLISSRSTSTSAFLIIFSTLLIVFIWLAPSSSCLCNRFCSFRTRKCDILRTFH